ncbi:B-cell scaffold protein with ankyrin repeats [Strigops habroptila]|uniref:B-cell scaffold protein with ankyrin repeats n=1 Tax=Strigops habroptila TaxID=2489341 RepID=UPI0011CEE7DB|nr:B-cell scaffold protein with ankyrin repeats [Strigops habroptila]
MKDILVIYEQEAKEWALYFKSLFGHVVNEEGILLYNIETSSFKQQELFSLHSYKCKLLILSCGLLNCLNRNRSYFLERVLKPPDTVVILLCGVENSEILYETLTLDRGSKEISTDQEPEEYFSVVTGIIQPGKPQNENPGDSLSCIYEAVNAYDHKTSSDVNLSDVRRASEKTDLSFKTAILSETLETNEQSILVLPGRISCENPGEIFILLKDEINDEALEIEFIADNQRIRTQPASWTKKIKHMKALDFPAGLVYVNVYCGGVIKTTAQIEYYTALEEIEHILNKVADPIAFTCQALKFSSVEKLDNLLTLLLKSKISTYEFSPFQSEEHHQQANSHLEEFPTLLHCAARFGLKNLATFLLNSPEATKACKIINKCGEDPATVAEKHGHRELRKLIREFSINTADNFTNCKVEVEDDDTYVVMLGSETQAAMTLKAKQNPGDQYGIGSRCQQEAEVGEEKKDNVEDSREETEHEDQEEEDSYSFHNSPDNLYATIPDDLKENRRDCFLCKRPPPPPPRNLPGIPRQDDVSQERNFVEDRSERGHGDGLITACYREDTCGGDDPYTFVTLDESVYDFVLAEAEEKRKERKSFIVNRPPAPAPRPVCSAVREEDTPYIMQVFQQKATRVPSDSNRTYCYARKPAHRGHTDTVTDSTVQHNIPTKQEELIHLQEQVKKGTISVDEALDRFKQWQKENQRLQSSQQEKAHHLRDSTVGNRLEKENLNVPKESRPESSHFRYLFHMSFNKASPTRNPTDKEEMPN